MFISPKKIVSEVILDDIGVGVIVPAVKDLLAVLIKEVGVYHSVQIFHEIIRYKRANGVVIQFRFVPIGTVAMDFRLVYFLSIAFSS